MNTDPPVFALAKIQPPRLRPGLIARPRLEKALGQALLEQRLTLLQAPAGYGKTSALTRQLQQLPPGSALAWISADEDDDLQRFLACLTAALEPFDLPWRVAPEALATLAQAERGPRRAADEIANALAGAEAAHGLIVIDDVHRLGDPQVFALLEALVERLPAPWGLVLASRVDPDLALARLRASDELAEFRQADLRFDDAEIGALLAHSGRADAPGLRALMQRAEGWAAGLRLSLAAGGSVGAAAQTQARRHLFDYLASEVLAQMPAELQDFLLRSSVLPELTAARCAALLEIGPAQAGRLLAEVERRGLFVSALDGAELTLRLHDLFRDFLDDQLERRHGAELPALLQRAASQEPDLMRAVGWLARAGDWAEAARRVTAQGQQLMAFGGIVSLSHTLALFPPAQLAAWPELLLLRALVGFMRFEFETMRDMALQAAQSLERQGHAERAAWARVLACLAMQNTGQAAEGIARMEAMPLDQMSLPTQVLGYFTLAWGQFAMVRAERAAVYFERMLEALEALPDAQLWSQCFFHCILTGLDGMRPLLERFDRGAMQLVEETPGLLRAGVFHSRAWLALGRGAVDEARAWLDRGAEDMRWVGSPRGVLTEQLLSRCLIDAVAGQRESALQAYEALLADLLDSAPCNRHTHGYEIYFSRLRIAWLLGDLDELPALEAQLRQAEHSMEWPLATLDRQVAQGMVASAQGRLDEAAAALEPVAQAPERSNFFIGSQSRWMLADVRARQGRLDEAAALLRPWLDAGLAGAELGGALMAGPQLLERLGAQRWGGRLSAAQLGLLLQLLARLRQAREGQRAPLAASPQPARAGRPEAGLTEREQEVLARIAAGDSNKLIARALALSPFTVKRHVANILDKLALSSRGQAAAWWRDRH